MKFLNRFGAYLAALVVFVAIACIYCAPSLQGLVVNAGDTSHYKGAVQEVKQYHEQTGDYSFWTGSMFSGMPNYQIGGGHYKSATLLKPLKRIALAGHRQGATPAILIVYFISFFILLRAFKVNPWLSIVGAVAIGLSSYFLVIIPAGHITKTSTIALMAMAIGGFHLIYRKRYGPGALLTAFPVAIAFVNHPQMGYYICMLIGILFFAELYIHIKERRMKDFGLATLVFALALLTGFGAQSANVFANREYAEQTMRGGHSDLQKADDATNKTRGLDLDYATQWSYGIGESLSFLVPGVRGCASGYNVGTGSKLYKSMTRQGIDRRAAAQFCQNAPLYWGEQPFTSGNVYMGAIVCFLFVLGILLVKGPYKWALVVATAFSIALAWGSNFMPLTKLFFNYFPLYNKFRTVSSILVVAEITMPLLGFLALRDMMGGGQDKKRVGRSVLIAAGITGGLCLVLAVFGGSLFSFRSSTDASWASDLPAFIYEGIIGERKAMLAADAWRSMIFIAGAALVVWLFSQRKLKSGWMTAILGLLITVDMWQVDKRFFNDGNFIPAKQEKAYFAMQPYEKQILADPDPNFRVMNLTTSTFNDARTSYYLKSIGGYSAAKLRRYQDLIDQHISQMNMNVLNMLNTKYFITKGTGGQPQVVRNPDAMGNAWFVDTLMVVDGANAESDALNRIDLHTTAVLDRQFAAFAPQSVLAPDSTRSIRLTKYTPRYLDYESVSAQPGTVVFSEIYYPYGWHATIDGQPADHFRANYTLRALSVPAGKHRIHFEFAPDSVRRGDTLSMVCIIILYAATLLVVLHALLGRKRLRRN